MEIARIRNLKASLGEKVTLRGWVYNKRSSGKIKFLLLRDGSGTIQCVLVKGETPPEALEQFETLTQESAVLVKGEVREDKRSPLGVELGLENIELLHQAQEYPIGKKEHGPDFLLSNRHLWLRSARQHAILTIRDAFIWASREFFKKEGFVLVDTPIFTPAACEGTSTLFETEYFGNKAYLSQSGQLYGEAAAMAFGKVYCLGPTFRAEKSKTRRHLTEFWMLEPEVAFNDLDANMTLAENYLEYAVQKTLKDCQAEFQILKRDTTKLENVKAPFPRITYTEAVERLNNETKQTFEWGEDFGAPEETALGDLYEKPIFIHRYPAKIKAFYMKRAPEDENLALGVDCIAPEGYGEIIGGSQREEDYDTLLKRIHEHDLPEANFQWYLDLRRYGSVPHSGFGLGIERTISWLCGLDHLRETALFPRLIHRLDP